MVRFTQTMQLPCSYYKYYMKGKTTLSFCIGEKYRHILCILRSNKCFYHVVLVVKTTFPFEMLYLLAQTSYQVSGILI